MNSLAKSLIGGNGIIIKGNKVNLKNKPLEDNCKNELPLQNGR